MRYSLDSNVLVYALDRGERQKRDIALDIISRADGLLLVLTSQVIGEFLNVVRRKNAAAYEEAIGLAADWSLLFATSPTQPEHVIAGARLAQRHKLQLWDSIILVSAKAMGAETLLTEDMQDGAIIDDVRIVNPFAPANAAIVASLND
ncbi:PIN domain-containing protein [Sphingomonas sp. S1-29]|uniref:PIN domain-containing protein n=1 Tax=Sphingomonas sp. S1-29 TaxID=2991074 RepID=UPI00223FACB7|nr:PIN domain-containing protein [Sphingomonas sp. S1-29]UZK69219.1 PIN domain-containing protein [Sphingomonas sp. S1-29]